MKSFIWTEIDIKYLVVVSVQILNLLPELQPNFHFEYSGVLTIFINRNIFNHYARIFYFLNIVLNFLDLISVQLNEFSDIRYHYNCR